ncbi:16S rRNA (cytosine(1402)-N(4))-methyltransferase [Candidatus Shapirobacteria bacterium CG09_land_8_20_14_0_10_39_12]|uniref:Ribosomal RNA small subunit methyltransferase H n=1 Tax=Candidatus Shapirobacteria bacterium CG09_land_8_20_14_0_10_39_12 TaxID=1974885 RepID=A0A2H0WPF7_9BACT|nr:MAG: 16S rRNA (cytosine(1402)-N(4))-methyltransferase [Candidatus Shapirobacteria bacterium CG09_land_8_20_14_0_10_39_12]
MKTSNTYHIPALLNETVDLLNVKPGKRFIDATLGGGGHSEEIVRKKGMLLGIDQDPEAVSFASERLKTFACPGLVPPKIVQSNFSRIDEVAKDVGFEKVDGILFDLGVSSHQLETAQRGFSFNQGPLDMRMDKTFSVTAKDLVNGLNEGELADLFLKLGEERLSQRYAKAICKERLIKPIATCNELSEIIVKEALPRGKFDRTHPATRVFQALRIAVNDELNSLKEALPKAVELLNKKGRLVLLSFHSLEDGIVKRFFLDQEEKGILKIITKKPITPSAEEVNLNPRARSAKLRAAEKIC